MNSFRSVLITILFAAGCNSNTPTTEQMKSADFGAFPTKYQEQIKENVSTSLFDPYSAHFRFSEPYKVWTTSGLIYNRGVTGYGYCDLVYVNAKNRFGGYVGEQPFYFLIKDDQVKEITAQEYSLFVHSIPLEESPYYEASGVDHAKLGD